MLHFSPARLCLALFCALQLVVPASAVLDTPIQKNDRAAVTETVQAARIEDSWFDDALFLGDSFVGPLYNVSILYGGLGNAQILHYNGLACHNITKKDIRIPYKGDSYPIPELLARSGAGKLFLFIAMNDVGQKREILDSSWDSLIADIRELNPDVQIYIQACLPIFVERAFLTNEAINELNQWLREICARNGCTYVVVSDGMCDEDDRLKQEYSTDGTHVSLEASQIWIENLHDPANYETFER